MKFSPRTKYIFAQCFYSVTCFRFLFVLSFLFLASIWTVLSYGRHHKTLKISNMLLLVKKTCWSVYVFISFLEQSSKLFFVSPFFLSSISAYYWLHLEARIAFRHCWRFLFFFLLTATKETMDIRSCTKKKQLEFPIVFPFSPFLAGRSAEKE